jgi:hypothetical protein
LGHILNCVRSQLNPKKRAAIQNFPTPNATTNVRAFMGLTWYYRRFIVTYAKIVKPLFTLTKKECNFFGHPYAK